MALSAKISLAAIRGKSAFQLLFKVSRIEHVSKVPRAGGPVKVGLCRDSVLVTLRREGKGRAENEEHFASFLFFLR